MAHEQPGDAVERRPEGQPDSHLPGPLRHRVGDHAVDPDHTDQQRHAARDREQDQRQGSAGEQASRDRLHCLDILERKVRINASHGLLHLVSQGQGAGSRCAGNIRQAAHGGDAATRILPKNGQVDHTRGLLIDAVIA